MPRKPPLDTPIDRAVREVAAGHPADAAIVLEQLGSLPLAARSRMLAAAEAHKRSPAEAAQHAAMARTFYESVGATLLAKQAAARARAGVALQRVRIQGSTLTTAIPIRQSPCRPPPLVRDVSSDACGLSVTACTSSEGPNSLPIKRGRGRLLGPRTEVPSVTRADSGFLFLAS